MIAQQSEKMEGWAVPPRLDDKVVFSDLKKDHRTQALISELQHIMPSVPTRGFLTFMKTLIEHEKMLENRISHSRS